MRKKLKEKISESLTSVLPVTVIVLILSFTLTPMPNGTMLLFLLGAAMLILGMGFFSLGADMAMVPIGEQMGRRLGPGSRLPMVIVVCFLIGVFVTIAEPDLTVLAKQVPAVPDLVIVLTVAVGVGVFLVASMLRTRFNIPLAPTLLVLYIGVFILSIFVPNEFLAVAFDSGGVTTGPITVPFIMALGTGIASIQGREEDNFGMVAMCSVGPILAVMVLPTIIQVSETALRAVPASYREASLALGNTRIGTIFRVMLPAARSGILAGVILGVGRAIGETMAVIMVCGNTVNFPELLKAVRPLTTGVVLELSYSSGLHRQALFSIGLVLFVFIMIVNIAFTALSKRGVRIDGKE